MSVDYIKHGDCLELMQEIPAKSIDMILCDLPYGITNCKWDSIIPLDLLWNQYNRIIKDGGVIALFGSEPFPSVLRISNLHNYKYDWYWIKNKPSGALTAKKQPMKTVETISIFYKKTPTYSPQMTERSEAELKRLSKKSVKTSGTDIDNRKWGRSGNRNDNKLKYPRNTLTHKTVFNRSKEKVAHPTQKPVDMLEYLIKTYTHENDIILDNCMGSGSTCVAAINTNRHYIGFEIEQKYFDISAERISKTKTK